MLVCEGRLMAEISTDPKYLRRRHTTGRCSGRPPRWAGDGWRGMIDLGHRIGFPVMLRVKTDRYTKGIVSTGWKVSRFLSQTPFVLNRTTRSI